MGVLIPPIESVGTSDAEMLLGFDFSGGRMFLYYFAGACCLAVD